jgi:hypothetical protein
MAQVSAQGFEQLRTPPGSRKKALDRAERARLA